jgi:hypothetical protein
VRLADLSGLLLYFEKALFEALIDGCTRAKKLVFPLSAHIPRTAFCLF